MLETNLAVFEAYEGEEVADGMARDFRELAIADLDFTRKVGEGASGRVFMGMWRDATVVAIKELSVACDERAKQDFIHEANVMARIGNHPNVVHFIGAVTTEDRFYMVSEFALNGSLFDYLVTRGTEVDEEQLLRFAADGAAGLAHLHAEGVVHRDIACRNFLVARDLTVLVSDFGMSRVIDQANSEGSLAKRTKTIVGPVRWMAPESIRSREYSQKSDVFMFGMFLYELCAREVPYAELAVEDVIVGVCREKLRPDLATGRFGVPTVFEKIMIRCWKEDPQQRPQMAEVIQQLTGEEGLMESSYLASTQRMSTMLENTTVFSGQASMYSEIDENDIIRPAAGGSNQAAAGASASTGTGTGVAVPTTVNYAAANHVVDEEVNNQLIALRSENERLKTLLTENGIKF